MISNITLLMFLVSIIGIIVSLVLLIVNSIKKKDKSKNLKLMGGFSGLAVIAILGQMFFGTPSNTTNSNVPDSQLEQHSQSEVETNDNIENENKTDNKAEVDTNAGKMTKAKFDEIQNGMTYEEVTKIIGGEGEVLSESGQKGQQFHTIMYQYEGVGNLGANSNLMFQEGKLVNKAQFGLK